ncbi:MAG: phage baseplate assembly protein V [Treponema sp.]|nr:phage baseplate assembly protein V [Treponema sp.]
MGLKKLTVCNASGKISQKTDNKETLKGTIVPAVDSLYDFYAGTPNDAGDAITEKETESPTLVPYQITLLLPVGGNVSGLFRFPRVGEQVLVELGDNSQNYLIGYVPSEDISEGTSFTPDTSDPEKNKLLQENQGMVLRYQQTGKKADKAAEDEKYSEIGFYRQPTSWKPGNPGDYQAFGAGESKDFPKIDRINIQSTGDIHSKAQNHYRTKAKRFELLVDCDGPNYAKDPDEYDREDFAFGDQAGDDSMLYAGDAHIRAKNRIIIKAGEEIRLQVGRSSIIISDKGITIVSRKTRSPIENPWDTKVCVTPLGGIDMFGHRVQMKAAKDFSLADSFGGALTSYLGVTRIASKDFKAQATNLQGYFLTGGGTLTNYLNIVPTMLAGAVIGTGKHGVSQGLGAKASFANQLPTSVGMAPDLVALVGNIIAGTLDADGSEGSDPINDFIKYFKIVGTVLGLIPLLLEVFIPKKNLMEYGGRDGLITAVSIAEIGVMTTAFCYVCTKIVTSLMTGWGATPFHTSYLHLEGHANLALGGVRIVKAMQNELGLNSPVAGLGPDMITKQLSNITSTKVILGIVGGIVGIGAAIGAPFLKAYVSKLDEEELAKLKEL